MEEQSDVVTGIDVSDKELFDLLTKRFKCWGLAAIQEVDGNDVYVLVQEGNSLTALGLLDYLKIRISKRMDIHTIDASDQE